MTSTQLSQAFTDAGLDTPDKITAIMKTLVIQSQIKQLDIQINSLSGKPMEEALKPVNDKILELNNERDTLVAQLNTP